MLVSLARCVLLVELESELDACEMSLVCLLRWQMARQSRNARAEAGASRARASATRRASRDERYTIRRASARASVASRTRHVVVTWNAFFSSARNSLIRYTILVLLVGSAKGWACASKYEKIAHPPCGPVRSPRVARSTRVSAALPSVISATLHTQLHTRIWPSTPARSTNATCARAQLQTSVTSARLERSSTSGTAMPLSPSTASTFCCNSSAAAAS